MVGSILQSPESVNVSQHRWLQHRTAGCTKKKQAEYTATKIRTHNIRQGRAETKENQINAQAARKKNRLGTGGNQEGAWRAGALPRGFGARREAWFALPHPQGGRAERDHPGPGMPSDHAMDRVHNLISTGIHRKICYASCGALCDTVVQDRACPDA